MTRRLFPTGCGQCEVLHTEGPDFLLNNSSHHKVTEQRKGNMLEMLMMGRKEGEFVRGGVEAGVAAGGRKIKGGEVKGVKVEGEVETEKVNGGAGVESGIERTKRGDRKMKRVNLREWRKGRRKACLLLKMAT